MLLKLDKERVEDLMESEKEIKELLGGSLIFQEYTFFISIWELIYSFFK